MPLLTTKDINSVVKRACGVENITIVDHHLEDFSEHRTGLLGTHQVLVVEFEDEFAKKQTISFFVKSRPESTLIKNKLMDEKVFLEEIHFFSEVQPLMYKVYEGERWSPRCFLVNQNVLVLEDLRVQGFVTRTDDFDEESLKSTLSALARFHASSVLAESYSGKSLKELFPTWFEQKLYNENTKFGQVTPCCYESIAFIADKFGLDSTLVPKILERVKQLYRPSVNKLNALLHTDLWRNNILLNGAIPAKCIFVDFQLLTYASPLIDFSMLVYINTTPDYRKTKILEMLKHYYSVFRDVIIQSKMKIEAPLYETFLEDFYEYRLAGMSYALYVLPTIFLKQEDVHTIFNDPNALEKFLFKTRTELIGSTMDEDPVYREKMRALVEEFLKEAERVIR